MRKRIPSFHFASLLQSVSVLILGILIYGFAHANDQSTEIIGAGVTPQNERDFPAQCRIETEETGGDSVGYCSGTLVGSNEVVTAAHCFSRDFSLYFTTVRVWCGGRTMEALSVEVPPTKLWVNANTIVKENDFAKITTRDSLVGAMPAAKSPDLYFDSKGKLKPGVRCAVAGFGNSARSHFGTLNTADMSSQRIEYHDRMIYITDPVGAVLKTSVDSGDSGGTFYCKSGTHDLELVGVTIAYGVEKKHLRDRLANFFAPIWLHSL